MPEILNEITVPDLNDPLFAEYWVGTKSNELRIQRCDDSDLFYWPPQFRCTVSGSTNMSWVAVEPKGRIFSYVVVGKSMIAGFREPYTIAIVSLDTHPQIRIVGFIEMEGNSRLEIGTPVEGRFVPAGPNQEFTLLHWQPSSTS